MLYPTKPLNQITFEVNEDKIIYFSFEDKYTTFKLNTQQGISDCETFITKLLNDNPALNFVGFKVRTLPLNKTLTSQMSIFDLQTLFKNANLKELKNWQQIAYILGKDLTNANDIFQRLEMLNTLSQDKFVKNQMEIYNEFIKENHLKPENTLKTNSQLVEEVIISPTLKPANYKVADFYREEGFSSSGFKDPALNLANVFLTKQIFFPFRKNYNVESPLINTFETNDIFIRTPFFTKPEITNNANTLISQTIQQYGLDKNNQPSYKSNTNEFEVLLENHGHPIVLKTGLGGLHGALSNFVSQDKELWHADAESLHPTTMINHRRFPANFDIEKFENLYFERVFKKRLLLFIESLKNLSPNEVRETNFEFPFWNHIAKLSFTKNITDKIKLLKTTTDIKPILKELTTFAKKQASAKLVLVNTYGNILNRNSALYDEFAQRDVVYDGQLLMLSLIDKIKDDCILTQVNTDAIDFIPLNPEKCYQIIREFSQATKYNFEVEKYDKLFQANVNNFLTSFKGGEIKAKGAALKEYSNATKIINHQSVIDTPKTPIIAYTIVERLTKGRDVEEVLKTANNPLLFSQFIDVGAFDTLSKSETLLPPNNRIFIVKNPPNNNLIYKQKDEVWKKVPRQTVLKDYKNNVKLTIARFNEIKRGFAEKQSALKILKDEKFLIENFNAVNDKKFSTLKQCIDSAQEELNFIKELQVKQQTLKNQGSSGASQFKTSNPDKKRTNELLEEIKAFTSPYESKVKTSSLVFNNMLSTIPDDLKPFFLGGSLDSTKIASFTETIESQQAMKKGIFSTLLSNQDKTNSLFGLDENYVVKVSDYSRVKFNLPENTLIYNGDMKDVKLENGFLKTPDGDYELDLSWYKNEIFTFINDIEPKLLTNKELIEKSSKTSNEKQNFNNLREIQKARIESLNKPKNSIKL